MEKRWERMMKEDDDKDDGFPKEKNKKPGKMDPDDEPDDRSYLRPGELHDRLGKWIEAQRRAA